MRRRNCACTGMLTMGLLVTAVGTAHAQNPTGQSNMVFQMYANAATQWMQVAHGYAQKLFGLLAVIDFSWTAGMLALEGHELSTYIARIIRKLMTISFFAVILAQGAYWMGAISASFIKVGQAAGGTTNVTTPAQILGDGFLMAGSLLKWATTSATTISITSIAPMVPVLFALIVALFLLAGYAIVAINFVVTTIEGFVVIGAGYIFLGFGGSQWTRPYVERYIALAVSLGARMMILYMIVGLGHSFATQWVNILNQMSFLTVVSDPTDAFMTMCGILCGAVTYAGVAIMAPRLVGSIMSGSLSFSGNEALSMGSSAALGAAAVLAAVPTGGGSVAAAGGAAGAGTLSAGGASAAGLSAGANSAASATAMGLGTNVAAPAGTAAAGGGGASGAGGAATVAGGGMNVPPPPMPNGSAATSPGSGQNVAPPSGSSSSQTAQQGSGTPAQTNGTSGSPGASASSQPTNGTSSNTANSATPAGAPNGTGAAAAPPPPPSPLAGAPPASSPTSNGSADTGRSVRSSVQQAKGGLEQIVGATQIGSMAAPPPQAQIKGDE